MKRNQPLNMVNPNLERDSYLSDESVLEKGMNAVNGEKFKKLWNADTAGYSSHSEADAALCSMLTFYCNGNMEQVDRLFRQSALYRDPTSGGPPPTTTRAAQNLLHLLSGKPPDCMPAAIT